MLTFTIITHLGRDYGFPVVFLHKHNNQPCERLLASYCQLRLPFSRKGMEVSSIFLITCNFIMFLNLVFDIRFYHNCLGSEFK